METGLYLPLTFYLDYTRLFNLKNKLNYLKKTILRDENKKSDKLRNLSKMSLLTAENKDKFIFWL
jgi:hypothetical protein